MAPIVYAIEHKKINQFSQTGRGLESYLNQCFYRFDPCRLQRLWTAFEMRFALEFLELLILLLIRFEMLLLILFKIVGEPARPALQKCYGPLS